MPRPYLACVTNGQRSTISNALSCAAEKYDANALELAFEYAFPVGEAPRTHNPAWLRLAQQFQRQASEVRSLARTMRLV